MHKSWLVALALMTVAEAGAVSINIGTALNASSWTIDSDGFTFTAFQDGSAITVTSTGNRLGSTPLNLSTWDGVWKATLTFILPAGATNVALNTTAILPDDKLILALNGADFADHMVFDTTGPGTFFRNGASESVTYTNSQTVSLTSGFILGGVNTLVAYINNTDTADPNAPPSNFQFDAAATALTLGGAVTFDVPTSGAPEPGVLLLTAAGLAAMLFRRLRAN